MIGPVNEYTLVGMVTGAKVYDIHTGKRVVPPTVYRDVDTGEILKKS